MIGLLLKLFLHKYVDYSTDKKLYKAIDTYITQQNSVWGPDYHWTRGYQGLWIELRKVSKVVVINKKSQDDKENKQKIRL